MRVMLSTDESPGRLGPATSTDVLPNSLWQGGVRFWSSWENFTAVVLVELLPLFRVTLILLPGAELPGRKQCRSWITIRTHPCLAPDS